MARLLDRLKAIFQDRRKVTAQVCIDRRLGQQRPTLKDADEQLREAMDRLERTATLRRDDFYDQIERK